MACSACPPSRLGILAVEAGGRGGQSRGYRKRPADEALEVQKGERVPAGLSVLRLHLPPRSPRAGCTWGRERNREGRLHSSSPAGPGEKALCEGGRGPRVEAEGTRSCRGRGPRGRGPESGEGRRQEARAGGLGQLRAQESLDGRVDVPSRGDERLQVGLAVDEAHGVELLQLLLEPHFRRLHLRAQAW